MRIVISIVIVWHFTAIFLAALSIGTSSPLVGTVAQQPPMQWYLDLLFLNQGHSFFAPEVGPSSIVRYELFDERGSRIERGEGQLPDRKEHWPRLRYHRHFMLADQASMSAANEEEANYWQRKYLEMYARHLLRTNENAQAVRVRRFAHWPLPYDLVLAGLNSVRQEAKQLRDQNRVAEADQLESNLVKEGLRRGYAIAHREFSRGNQGGRIDEQGHELIMEVTQRRSDLEPPKMPPNQSQSYQANPWQSTNRVNAAGRWNQGGVR